MGRIFLEGGRGKLKFSAGNKFKEMTKVACNTELKKKTQPCQDSAET